MERLKRRRVSPTVVGTGGPAGLVSRPAAGGANTSTLVDTLTTTFKYFSSRPRSSTYDLAVLWEAWRSSCDMPASPLRHLSR